MRDNEKMSKEEVINIIDKYYNKTDWNWDDYYEAIERLFRATYDVGIDEIEASGKREAFYHCLSIVLGKAGEMGEFGYAFRGIETICKCAYCLDYHAVFGILKHFEKKGGSGFYNELRVKVIKALIENSGKTDDSIIDDEDRKCLKFRFFDMYYLAEAALKSFDSILTNRYPDYVFDTVENYNKESMKSNKPEINERIFFKVLKKGNDVLLEKVDVAKNYLFISLTRNSDINDMRDYIDDLQVDYNKNLITFSIKKNEGNDSNKSTSFSFYDDIWDVEELDNMAYGEKMNRFLKTNFHEGYIRFELVYLYAKNIYGSLEREVKFQNDLKVEVGDKIKVTKAEEKNKMPADFFGKNINNVMAVIGKNGSGKSSVFRMIIENPIFSDLPKSEYESKWGEYILIYKLNDYYYYTCSDSMVIDEDSQEILSKLEDRIFINICLLSNTMDIFSIEEGNGYVMPTGVLEGTVDLTTDTILRTFRGYKKSRPSGVKSNEDETDDPLQYFHMQEKERITNLNAFLTPDQKKALKLKEIDNNFSFSSGEYARWSLFARILSVFYRSSSLTSKLPEIAKTNNYFLFLDEAELYMHPEWQRNLINDILEFLKMINEKGKYFQNMTIILSSNSPFLMSDLPDDRIHLFDPVNNEHIKTFGQNIYNLLKNKFFMSDETIGAFAKLRIQEAFKQAENKLENKESSIEIAEYVNSIIGEEVYHYYLSEKLDEIRG